MSNRYELGAAPRAFMQLSEGEAALEAEGPSRTRRVVALGLATLILIALPAFWLAGPGGETAIGVASAKAAPGPGSDGSGGSGSSGDDDDDGDNSGPGKAGKRGDDTSRVTSRRGTTRGSRAGTDTGTSRGASQTRTRTRGGTQTRTRGGTQTRTGR